MKLIYEISLIVLGLAMGVQTTNAASPPPMKDTVSHDQLVAKLRVTVREDPMRKLEQSSRPDPSKANQPLDFISQSDVVCFGGRITLVPKRAILHVPANLSERLKVKPGAKIQNWAEFYAGNRSWITTVEVTRVQAEGNQTLGKDLMERLKDSPNLVIATLQGGPISVLPLKLPMPEKTPIAANLTQSHRP